MKQSSLKLGLFLDDSRLSGVSIYTKNLAKKVKNIFKIDCEIILPKKNSNSLVRQFLKEKISYRFYDIEMISKTNFTNYIKFFFFKIKNLIFFIKKNHYDIYLIQGSLQFINIFILGFIKKKKILVIHDAKNNYFFKFILKLIVKRDFRIIFVSMKSYNFYKDIFQKNKKIIISNGVDIKKKNIIKNKKFFIIGSSCNINPDKNLNFALDIAKILQTENFPIQIKIAGCVYKSQKKYFQSLLKKVKNEKLNNVKFLGFKKNIDKFLSTLDLYCCFSKTESSPLSVIEALHKGLPLVTTNVGDLNYHINKSKFGYVINKHDAHNFSSKIKKVLTNKKLYNRLSKNAFDYSRQKFDLNKNIKNFIKFID